MYKLLSLLFIFVISISAYAEMKIEVKTGRRTMYLWQKTYLQIKIKDEENMLYNAGYIDTSLINDFTVENISVSSSASEGQTRANAERTVVYTLRPIRTGTCLIPSFTIPYYGEFQEREAKIGSISFKVKDKNDFIKQILIIFIPVLVVFLLISVVIIKYFSVKKDKI